MMTEEELRAVEDAERLLVLGSFTQADAWRLGNIAVELATASGGALAIDIRRAGQVLFHSVMGGATADLESWVRRKSAVALRFEVSSQVVRTRMQLWQIDPGGNGWLDPEDYALSGGSIPIRVAGAGVVAAITVSGLTDEEDHALAEGALMRLRAEIEARTS